MREMALESLEGRPFGRLHCDDSMVETRTMSTSAHRSLCGFVTGGHVTIDLWLVFLLASAINDVDVHTVSIVIKPLHSTTVCMRLTIHS